MEIPRQLASVQILWCFMEGGGGENVALEKHSHGVSNSAPPPATPARTTFAMSRFLLDHPAAGSPVGSITAYGWKAFSPCVSTPSQSLVQTFRLTPTLALAHASWGGLPSCGWSTLDPLRIPSPRDGDSGQSVCEKKGSSLVQDCRYRSWWADLCTVEVLSSPLRSPASPVLSALYSRPCCARWLTSKYRLGDALSPSASGYEAEFPQVGQASASASAVVLESGKVQALCPLGPSKVGQGHLYSGCCSQLRMYIHTCACAAKRKPWASIPMQLARTL
jgi:hypothetical protein